MLKSKVAAVLSVSCNWAGIVLRHVFIRAKILFTIRSGIQDIKLNALMNKKIGEICLQEAAFLGGLARSVDSNRPIIEIGTHFGFSTEILCYNKPQETQLLTVDNYSWNSVGLSRSQHFEVTKNLLKEGVENFNVEQIKMDKNLFYSMYSGEYPSLVFLDAIHTYEETIKDIMWAKKVKADVICGHDYSSEYPGVIDAVHEMGGCRELIGSLWVLNTNI